MTDLRQTRFGVAVRQAARWWGLVTVLVAVPVLLAWHTAAAPDDPSSPPPEALTPIQSVVAPLDSLGVPVRLGDTVVVGGRASAAQGRLGGSGRVYIQDGSRGIALDLTTARTWPGGARRAMRGDSVWARGVVSQRNGLTILRVLDHGVPDVPLRTPASHVVSVDDAHGERYESMLVHLHGRVGNTGTNEGGRYLLLRSNDSDAVVAVFVENRQLGRVRLGRFQTGDRVDVTGVLVQHDYNAPYTSYYEVQPRTGSDLVRASVPTTYYRNVGIVTGGIVVVALLVIAGLRREVTRRTKQVADSQARFRRLAEATFEGIVVHRNGTILDVNQVITEMTGYDREELVGENALTFLTDATREIVQSNVESQYEDPYEAVIERKDGSTFPVEIEAKVVEQEGTGFRIAAIRDITKRKKEEAELLLAKEEAEQMARLKSSLLNNMSHELRTPVTSIIGYAELIIDEPPETHADFARHIRKSGKRLSDTLQSVLDMAQIEAGTLDLSVQTVDAGEVAREVVDDHRPAAREKDVDLAVNCSGTCTLRTDRSLVYRILTNLVHNAVKFTEHGDVVVEVEPTDSGVAMTVADTGVGISETFRPHVFDPFKQESDGRARDYEGTGLGLAITKHMVDLLGGTIQLSSTKHEGTTFVVNLPTVLDHDPKAEDASASSHEVLKSDVLKSDLLKEEKTERSGPDERRGSEERDEAERQTSAEREASADREGVDVGESRHASSSS